MTTPADHNQFDEFFAYFFAPNHGTPLAAIFRRNPRNHKVATLYLTHHTKSSQNTETLIAQAQTDLAGAMKTAVAIGELVPVSQTLRAALHQRGYDWPGYERIEIPIESLLEV